MAGYRTPGEVPGSNTRRIAMFVAFAVVVLLMVTPLIYLKGILSQRVGDASYQALATYAKSHNGDRSLDASAAEVYPTFIKKQVGGNKELLAKRAPDGSKCWVLIVEEGKIDPPRKGLKTDCDSA